MSIIMRASLDEGREASTPVSNRNRNEWPQSCRQKSFRIGDIDGDILGCRRSKPRARLCCASCYPLHLRVEGADNLPALHVIEIRHGAIVAAHHHRNHVVDGVSAGGAIRTTARSQSGPLASSFYEGGGKDEHQGLQRLVVAANSASTSRYLPDCISGVKYIIPFAKERELIATLPGLCNHTDGGEGISGYRHTPETCEAIRAAHKGKKQSPEVIEARVSQLRGRRLTAKQMANRVCMKGRTHSDETKAKMSVARTGLKRSQEGIERTAAWHRGKKRPAEARKRMSESQPKRAVVCVTTGSEFPSLTAAAEWLRSIGHEKATKAIVWLALSPEHRNRSSYGYVWRYA